MERDNKGNRFEDKPKKKKKRPGSKRKMKRDMVLLIDLEATCWKGRPPEGMKSEIIEIGISAVDYKTKEIRLRDTIIVKPEYSEVSDFCTELTTLTQEYLDEHGVSFAEACKILETKFKTRDRIWMSFGNYDKNQFKKDCKSKNVNYPFSQNYFNIKTLISFAYGLPKDLGVKQALDYFGFEFEGIPHRGGDDAFNTAKLVKPIFSVNQN